MEKGVRKIVYRFWLKRGIADRTLAVKGSHELPRISIAKTDPTQSLPIFSENGEGYASIEVLLGLEGFVYGWPVL